MGLAKILSIFNFNYDFWTDLILVQNIKVLHVNLVGNLDIIG